MSVSTLAVAYQKLREDLGFFAGYGRGEDFDEDSPWDDEQTATIQMCLESGLRAFYYCSFDWSFLKPIATLGLADGEKTILLPEDYASADGQVVFSDGNTAWSVPFGSAGQVYQAELRSPDTTGRPMYVCEEPLKGTSTQHGQRLQLHVYPTADADYTATLPYRIHPDCLSGTRPYAYGGPQHAQTLLQACKAAFERDVDDLIDGPQQRSFQNMLEQSKVMDRRNKPMALGENADRSDAIRRARGQSRSFLPILIDGTDYTT